MKNSGYSTDLPHLTVLSIYPGNVRISDKSTRKIYESGLSAVTSDTVCFPAKLVHGHIRNLAAHQVDRIFKDVFCLDDVRQVEVTSSEIAYFKVMSENGVTISNPHDPYLLNNPYYHSIPFESEYSDSYVCVTNPNNTNPVVKLFMDLIEEF